MGTESQQIVVVKSTKNVGIAFLLGAFFGPLGMFYSTLWGGIASSVIITIIFLGVGIKSWLYLMIFTPPICAVLSAVAASLHNKKTTQLKVPK